MRRASARTAGNGHVRPIIVAALPQRPYLSLPPIGKPYLWHLATLWRFGALGIPRLGPASAVRQPFQADPFYRFTLKRGIAWKGEPATIEACMANDRGQPAGGRQNCQFGMTARSSGMRGSIKAGAVAKWEREFDSR
jgi:hypothetical protein